MCITLPLRYQPDESISDNIADLVQRLEALGANKVFTYDDLKDRELRKKVATLTGNAVCVCY